MPHPRVHVRLRTFDVVVQVVPEQLDVRDGSGRYGRVREVAGEEDKGNIADVFMGLKSRYVLDFEGRITVGV